MPKSQVSQSNLADIDKFLKPPKKQSTAAAADSRSRRRHCHHGLDRICHEKQEECELQR
jgi:hypothetical protein